MEEGEILEDCLEEESLGASLVAQLVKNPPAMQEAWGRSLSWEDPLEEEESLALS